MVTKIVLQWRDRWDAIQTRALEYPTIAAIAFVLSVVLGVQGFFYGEAPWTVIKNWVVWGMPLMTAANVANGALLLLAILSALTVLSAYSRQKTTALETKIELINVRQDLTGRLEIATSQGALWQAKFDVVELERDDALSEVERLKNEALAFPQQLAIYKHEAHQANRRWSAIAFQQLVMRAERENWTVSVTIRWVEKEDTNLADGIAAVFNELAPNWPITKDRDSGSELRQSGDARIVFESVTRDLAATTSFCFSTAKWAGEPTTWSQTEEPNLLVTIYPKLENTNG